MSEWERSTIRGRWIARAALLLMFGGIAFVTYSLRQGSWFHARHATAKYEEGMRILKTSKTDKDYNAAKTLFIEVVRAGDSRGNFGLACIIYRKHPAVGIDIDGTAAIHAPVYILHLELAANGGSLAAKAAYIGYVHSRPPWMGGTLYFMDYVADILAASRAPLSSSRDDIALPELSFIEKFTTDSEDYATRVLRLSLCGAPLPFSKIKSLIKTGEGKH